MKKDWIGDYEFRLVQTYPSNYLKAGDIIEDELRGGWLLVGMEHQSDRSIGIFAKLKQ